MSYSFCFPQCLAHSSVWKSCPTAIRVWSIGSTTTSWQRSHTAYL